MKNHRLLAVSSLFLVATVSAGVAGRAVANTEVDSGAVLSRLETLVGDRDAISALRGQASRPLSCRSFGASAPKPKDYTVNLTPAGAVFRWSDADAGGDHFDANWHFVAAGKIKFSEEID